MTAIRARSATDAETGGERTRLKEEYVRAGYAPHLAEYYATLHAEQAKTFAARYGLDAATLLRQRSVVRGKSGEMTDGGKGISLLQPASGEEVIYPDNGVALGQVTREIAATLSLDKTGAIVLNDIGLQHIEDRHGGEIRALGFPDGREFVKFVLGNLDAVYDVDGNGRKYDLVSRAMRPQGRVMVRLEFAESGDFYQVVTAGPVRKTQYKNKVPLWEGAHSTLPREGNPLVAHRASQRGQSGENSIASDIDKGKSFLAADGGGLHQAALYEQTPLGDTARASLERDIRDFGAAVDNIVAAGVPPSQPVKMLGQTPLVMRLLGRNTVAGKAAAQGGVYAAPHVFDGTHPNMTPELWKQIPAALADPVAVFDSDSPAGRARGDLVFMLELTDADGATVVVPVALQAKGKLGARVNIVKSAYAKENSGVPANTWFLRQLKKNTRYVNEKKWKHWRDIGSGAASPLVVPSNASNNTVYTDADLVKLREAQPTLYQSRLDETAAPGGNEKAQRFAALPPIEADSSLWFGEGKAIEASPEALREAVKAWARQSYPEGMTIRNADQGWDVSVTPRGIKASLSHGFDEILARSVPFIPQIIESGIHLDSIEKKPGLMSHIFANRIRLDGQEYVVGFVLREDGNGNRFYDHELTKIIDPGSLNTVRFPEGSVVHVARANRGDVMNILRDRLGVNDGTGQVFFQARESGTPAVVVRGDELGVPNGADIREYIAAAKTYHDALKYESEHGRPVHNKSPEFADKKIRFSGKGWRKNINAGADKRKWQLFPFLRSILENAEYVRTETTSGRGDEFSRAHWFECEVELGGERLRSGFTLLEDANGNLFYNLNADISGTEKGKAPHGLKPDAQSRGHEELSQSANAPVAETLPVPDDGVNLMFLSSSSLEHKAFQTIRPGVFAEKTRLSRVQPDLRCELSHATAKKSRSAAGQQVCGRTKRQGKSIKKKAPCGVLRFEGIPKRRYRPGDYDFTPAGRTGPVLWLFPACRTGRRLSTPLFQLFSGRRRARRAG